MTVSGKRIYLYGVENSGAPLILVNTYDGDDGKSLYEHIRERATKPLTLAVISGVDWNRELSPWEHPRIYKRDEDFTGGANTYIMEIAEEILPAIRKQLSGEPEYIAIAGYSLAGLFAIYSLYKTALFTRAVSASGSLWFPEFGNFLRQQAFAGDVDRVYFSLGERESHVKNPIVATVEDETRRAFEHVRGQGVDTILEMNPGNHFTDDELRLAKGIAWVL